MLTFANFITIAMDAFCILETLLTMPSAINNGKTIFIVSLASEAELSEMSHNLVVNEVTARHKLSPEFRTVSFMSSIARNATVHMLFKCLDTCSRIETI